MPPGIERVVRRERNRFDPAHAFHTFGKRFVLYIV